LRIDNLFWGNLFPPVFSRRESPGIVQRRSTQKKMKLSLEKYSGDVNTNSGNIVFSIHLNPESIFTSRRNPYSHHPGIFIHMPRNPHTEEQHMKKLAFGVFLFASVCFCQSPGKERDTLPALLDEVHQLR
jgi:hypothetical protein